MRTFYGRFDKKGRPFFEDVPGQEGTCLLLYTSREDAPELDEAQKAEAPIIKLQDLPLMSFTFASKAERVLVVEVVNGVRRCKNWLEYLGVKRPARAPAEVRANA